MPLNYQLERAGKPFSLPAGQRTAMRLHVVHEFTPAREE